MTYTIRQDGKDSGPYSRGALREMWAAGAVGPGTMFRAGASDVWLVAADGEGEICAEAAPPSLPAALPPAVLARVTAGAQGDVVVRGARVPFGDVLALTFKVLASLVILSPLIVFALFVVLAVVSVFFGVVLSPSFLRGVGHGMGGP